jgi:hypothetical protein
VRNQPFKGVSDLFKISLMRKGTDYVKEYRNNMLGVKIDAGRIEEVLMSPIDDVAKEV